MDKERLRIGFIGFGEVAQTLSQRMIKKGGEIIAYDKFPSNVSRKAKALNVLLVQNLNELAVSCPIILSTLWPVAALDGAKQIAALLSPETIYCDLNSISPETTSQIQRIVSSNGAEFVKIAVMAAITDRGYAVPLLAGGPKAGEVARLLTALGLTVQVMGHDPGQPAAFKILRSICLKGVVALTYEMLKGAEKYKMGEQLLESVSEVMAKGSFKDVVGGWLASTAIHAERRAGEMTEAIETLKTAGIRPIMSESIKEVFEEIARLKLDNVNEGDISGTLDFVFKR